MSPQERTRKTGQENGMVCYVSMKTFRDIKDLNSVKSAESAKNTKFNLKYLKKFSSKHNITYHFLR